MVMKHFVTIAATTREELDHVFDVAIELRRQRMQGKANQPALAGQTLAMIFEKPSLRTRVSFEQAMYELGGRTIVMGAAEVGLGKREPASDVARVLCGMVQGIMARVFEHEKLMELAAHSSVPVINALSDFSHPCQALADALTLMDEFGRDLTGRSIAFIGDGNNVARSLAVLCGRLKIRFILASPPEYAFDAKAIERLKQQAPGLDILVTSDPQEAVRQADALYTDTWVSMGQETETRQRMASFKNYQINAKLLSLVPAHAVVMHCLPAYRGHEITADVLEGPRSRVFPQAHNRLHVQKGLLAVLMGGL